MASASNPGCLSKKKEINEMENKAINTSPRIPASELKRFEMMEKFSTPTNLFCK
jgi:hypothetical protein